MSPASPSPPATPSPPPRRVAWLPALLAWGLGGAAMAALDGHVGLAHQALLLVLASALASLWLPVWASLAANAAAVLAFNWALVPPRYSLRVDSPQDALLLAELLAAGAIVCALVAGQRRLALQARLHAGRERRLRAWGDALRDASDPAAHASALQQALQEATGAPAVLHLWPEAPPFDEAGRLAVGEAGADASAGLALCARENRALGAGSGRHEEQPDVYLPFRGPGGPGGARGAAVLLGLGAGGRADAEVLAHAQALCDQMGGALQRWRAARDGQRSREAAHEQGVRNTLLAAISHDYRTPLAAIMGAASSLQQQAERLDVAQRRRLAGSIVDEVERLGRMTDNTLQLARLGAPGVALRCDWESAEEIAGAVLRRARRQPGGDRVRVRLEPELPLLWCDAMLVSQLLDNLVHNALKYSPPDAPVELLVRRIGPQLMLAVRDRGPGIEPAWRERVFEVFRRGEPAADAVPAQRPGAGVGLAVCRAIARAHEGEIRLRPRAHGGCAFEFRLPVREPPPLPAEEAP